ncbi:MAG: FAD-dependent oxidoreductase [Actinomycetales bacterium]
MTTPYESLFQPITIGTMDLRNRVLLPPHASAIGNIYGSDEDAARNIAYFESRCREDGPGWVTALSTHVRNTVIPGFDPTGVGAPTLGFFRLPFFVERVQAFTDALHALDTKVGVQFVNQGGMPHGPSQTMSAPVINLMPHVMTTDDILEFVAEYAESARLCEAGRADGIELHFNHDDIFEWFLSPLTNHRDDAYGGSLEKRCRFGEEVLRGIREVVGTSMTVGIRLNIREESPEGYDVAGGVQIAQYYESTGLIDYVHGVVGSPWGNPSYIQPTYFDAGQYAELAGRLKAGLSLPTVHTGRINTPEVAARILLEGQADVVGMARAHIADANLLAKARRGEADTIRPCVGGNECISRRYVEGLGFACAVNPGTSHEVEGPFPAPPQQAGPDRRPAVGSEILVVGGGPAGMEFAALMAEAGHRVRLWEADAELGGQLRYAAMAPRHEMYAEYLRWQPARLDRAGVRVETNRLATAEEVLAAGADLVAVATGARPRRPAVPGVAGENVLDVREVMAGRANPGHRVLVVSQDDHVAPLSVADLLGERGHEVTVLYATTGPAPLLGRYILGGVLGRLDEHGVRFRFMEELRAIEGTQVLVRNVYSLREQRLAGFDSVVLACGSESDAKLFDEVSAQHARAYVLGDAYAPRRLVFATKQAYALADRLLRGADAVPEWERAI